MFHSTAFLENEHQPQKPMSWAWNVSVPQRGQRAEALGNLLGRTLSLPLSGRNPRSAFHLLCSGWGHCTHHKAVLRIKSGNSCQAIINTGVVICVRVTPIYSMSTNYLESPPPASPLLRGDYFNNYLSLCLELRKPCFIHNLRKQSQRQPRKDNVITTL